MKKVFKTIYEYVINPPGDDDLSKSWQVSAQQLPTLWLLGKTGAGKTSIVQKITGQSAAVIGNGFMPCTKNASAYDFPEDLPIMRFMDTRGLGELEYDPADDLAALGKASQALLVVLRLRDSEQSAVLDALKRIRKSDAQIRREHVMVVHTAATEITDVNDRQRAVAAKQALVENIWGKSLGCCVVDFFETEIDGALNDYGSDALDEMISARLPELSLWLNKSEHENAEQTNYDRLSSEVLWYATAVASSDAIPAVGLVSVPAIQGKMLHSLAQQYGIEWDRRSFAEFTGALGASAVLSYGVSLGVRQLVKLIPIYGQIAGTALSVSVSYASTYAIGRAACSYLYHKKTNTPMADNALKGIYKKAAKQGRAAKKEMNQEQDS
ncbi:MAG: GTPase [Motiliproteus sp.]